MTWRCDFAVVSVWVDKTMCCWWRPEFAVQQFYTKIFKGILEPSFAGKEDVQLRVSKMSSIRNKLYHGNSISIRKAEQAICYSHDFIDCFNEYYRKIGDLAESVGGLTLRPGDVSCLLHLHASLITKREWHKSCGSDDWFSDFIGEVLSPVEDLY